MKNIKTFNEFNQINEGAMALAPLGPIILIAHFFVYGYNVAKTAIESGLFKKYKKELGELLVGIDYSKNQKLKNLVDEINKVKSCFTSGEQEGCSKEERNAQEIYKQFLYELQKELTHEQFMRYQELMNEIDWLADEKLGFLKDRNVKFTGWKYQKGLL